MFLDLHLFINFLYLKSNFGIENICLKHKSVSFNHSFFLYILMFITPL